VSGQLATDSHVSLASLETVDGADVDGTDVDS